MTRPHWHSTYVQPDPVVPGRWLAEVDPVWITAQVPLGGTNAAIAARAMQAELVRQHPHTAGQVLRALNVVFVSPVPHGPVVADVQVLRAGRTASQCRVRVRGADNDLGLEAIAVFGSPRPAFSFVDRFPPEVPAPEHCRSYRDPLPPDVRGLPRDESPLWTEVIEGRGALGLAPWDPTPRSSSQTASWMRYDQPPLGPDGQPDLLAVVTLGDLMMGSVGQRMGPAGGVWFAPSANLDLHVFAPARSEWILSHQRARQVEDGYASVEVELWDPLPEGGFRLLACGTQVAIFSFFEAPTA